MIWTRKKFGIGLVILGVGIGGAILSQQNEVRAELGIPGPRALSYKGSLTSASGPVEGSVDMQILLYDSPALSQEICRHEANTTPVSGGRFEVALNDSCTSAVLENDEAWISIAVDLRDGDGFQVFPPERIHATPYAIRARSAHNGVPLGGVIWWTRESIEEPIPEGYQLCDGSEIVEGPLAGSLSPNLIGVFVRGANTSGTEQIAGTPIQTNSAGEHSHLVLRYNHSSRQWRNAQGNVLMDWGDGVGDDGSGEYPLAATQTRDIVSDTEPSHSHSLAPPIPVHVPLVPIIRIHN